MRSTLALKRGLVKVQRESRAGRYDRALAQVDRLLEQYCDNPRLLVLRGELIQLLDEQAAPGLEHAKAALQRAVELDEESPAALIELGHFLYAVEDDAGAACKHFEKAILLGKSLLREAMLGQAEVLSELGRRRESLAYLAQAYWLQSHNGVESADQDETDILERLDHLRYAQ